MLEITKNIHLHSCKPQVNAKFLLSNDYLTQTTIAQRLTLKIQYSLLRKVNIKGSEFEPVSPQLLSIYNN